MKKLLVYFVILFGLVWRSAVSESGDEVNSTEDDYEIDFRVNRIDPLESEASLPIDEVKDYYYFDYYGDPRNEIPYLNYKKWIKGWRKYPLFLIIIGGFRWDLLTQERLKSLKSFAYLSQHGTTIPKVTPSFPAEDFSVWSSIASGLYSEDHGVVGDFMYDLSHRKLFNRSDSKSMSDPHWWKHFNPIWEEAKRYERKVAIFNWHHCDRLGKTTNGTTKKCSPYKHLKEANSQEKMALHFNEAFNKIHRNKYDLSIVYTDTIKRAMEKHGARSPALDKALKDVDDILQAKLTDIRSKTKLGLKMNMVVISDYGMTDIQGTETLYLDEIFDLNIVQFIIYSSGYATIAPYSLKQSHLLEVCEGTKGIQCYLTAHIQHPPVPSSKILPENLHYRFGEYVQDIVVLADLAYDFKARKVSNKLIPVNRYVQGNRKAGSGWTTRPVEPYFKKLPRGKKMKDASEEFNISYTLHQNYMKYKDDMKTMAFAMGPDFKANYVLPNPIETVDIYQVLCFLLQIPPEAHSGNWKRIESMLRISGVSCTLPSYLILILCVYFLYKFK
uniref:glycerophosphocholine cholinephosphodiesterase n=1 Tax=Lepeophtheirus salmonis TaxID=72036 RepID=A0A0K2UR48_LEPSM